MEHLSLPLILTSQGPKGTAPRAEPIMHKNVMIMLCCTAQEISQLCSRYCQLCLRYGQLCSRYLLSISGYETSICYKSLSNIFLPALLLSLLCLCLTEAIWLVTMLRLRETSSLQAVQNNFPLETFRFASGKSRTLLCGVIDFEVVEQEGRFLQ